MFRPLVSPWCTRHTLRSNTAAEKLSPGKRVYTCLEEARLGKLCPTPARSSPLTGDTRTCHRGSEASQPYSPGTFALVTLEPWELVGPLGDVYLSPMITFLFGLAVLIFMGFNAFPK